VPFFGYFLWHQRKYRIPFWFFGIKESNGKPVYFEHQRKYRQELWSLGTFFATKESTRKLL